MIYEIITNVIPYFTDEKKLDTEHLNNLSKVTIRVTHGGRIWILAVLIPESVQTILVFTCESSEVLQVEGLENMRDAKQTKESQETSILKGRAKEQEKEGWG